MSRESVRARAKAWQFTAWASLRGLHLVNACQNHGPVENCKLPQYQRDVKALQDMEADIPALLAVADAAAEVSALLMDEHRSVDGLAATRLADALAALEALP